MECDVLLQAIRSELIYASSPKPVVNSAPSDYLQIAKISSTPTFITDRH